MTLPKLRVIHLGGVSHNGATFMGVTLGAHPQIESVGEVSLLPRWGWSGDYLCACDTRIADCTYWSNVRAIWEQTVNDKVDALIELEKAFDRNRSFPRLMIEKFVDSSMFAKYSEYTYALLDAIRQVSGSSIIVNSSKRYTRALALSKMDSIDLRFVHLVRDARGVAHSWSKPKRPRRRTWLESSIRWNLTNRAFDYVYTRADHVKMMRVRYEDFILEPEATLNRIGAFIDADLSSVATAVSQGEALPVGHVGIGNGLLRRNSEVRLRSNIDWPQEISTKNQQRIWRLTQGMMRRCGYTQ